MTTLMTTALTPALDLIAQQEELETEMTSQGIARFRAVVEAARADGREDGTVYGMKLLDGLLDKVTDGIKAFIAERESGKAGRKGPAYGHLKNFEGDYEVVAFIALRLTLASLHGKLTSSTLVAGRIGRAVEDEYRYRDVREQDRKFYQNLRVEAGKRSAYHVKRKVVNLFIARREMDMPQAWVESETVMVGLLLLEIVMETTGLVVKEKIETGAKASKTILVPTEETKEFVANRVAAAEVMRPVYEPMVIPPVDWTGPFNGGYLTRRVRPLRLVKSFNRKYLIALESQDISDVMASVNAAQRTAWSINPFILTVLEMAWEKDFTHISRVVRNWKFQRGLPDGDEACFHTFRHTACSRLVQLGVPITVVQKFMGHAHIETTMRYAHLAPDSLDLAREALEKRTAA
jgi:DNA-directed RNA polymerase